jgi:hypothetical protein
MAIEVGDAVLKCLVDTSNLDGEFARVGSEAEKGLEPATDALDGVSEGFKDAAKEGNKAADEMVDAGRRSSASLREAKGEAALLGEAFGVHLPRHVRSFVAELPGVGNALTAAFSATAVLFLIQALTEGAEKISNWIANTFIFTQAMKESNDAIIKFNQQALAHIATMQKLDEAYKSVGVGALQKLQEEQGKTAHEVGLYSDALDRAKGKLQEIGPRPEDVAVQDEYGNALASTGNEAEEWDRKVSQAHDDIILATQKLQEAQRRAQLADREYTEALQADRLKEAVLSISLSKSTGEVLLNLTEQKAKEQATQQQASKEQLESIEVSFINKRSALVIRSLREQLAAENKYGHDNSEKIKELNAEIEKETLSHYAKLSAIRTKDAEEVNKQLDEETKKLDKSLAEMQKAMVEHQVQVILPQNIQRLLQFRAAAKELGVTLDTDLAQKVALAKKELADYAAMGGKDVRVINALKEALNKAQTAFSQFGVVSLEVRLKENKAALENAETQLVEAKARHQNVTAIEQQISALKRVQAELKKEQVAADKTKDTIERLNDSAKQSAQELGNAVASAMQGMLTHQESFGRAMEKAVLGTIAKQAQAWGQYYIGIGTAELLTGDPSGGLVLAEGVALEALAGVLGAIGGGVNASSGASGTAGTAYGSGKNNYQYGSSVSDTGSQASSGRSNIGVQGFAEGGLVSAPTLAMIGEGGGREAALPLDDPEAMNTVGKAIAGAQGGESGLHVHFHAPVIGASDVARLCQQINKRVARGQATLKVLQRSKLLSGVGSMKQPTSEVKQEILAKLIAFMRQLTTDLLERRVPLEDANGAMGAYIYELTKIYGPEAVHCVTNELNETLNGASPLQPPTINKSAWIN